MAEEHPKIGLGRRKGEARGMPGTPGIKQSSGLKQLCSLTLRSGLEQLARCSGPRAKSWVLLCRGLGIPPSRLSEPVEASQAADAYVWPLRRFRHLARMRSKETLLGY